MNKSIHFFYTEKVRSLKQADETGACTPSSPFSILLNIAVFLAVKGCFDLAAATPNQRGRRVVAAAGSFTSRELAGTPI